MRRLISFSICILTLSIAFIVSNESNSYARDIEDTVIKSFTVKRGQLFYLKADLGSVEVDSWAQNEVKVTVVKKADTNSKSRAEEIFEDLDLSFDQDNEGVKVRAEYHGPKGWWGERRRLNLRFEVMVPREFNLDVNTAGGGIQVTDLIGRSDLNTSGGSITVGRVDGPVNAKTSGGSIKVQEARGHVLAHTSGGSISIGETAGSVDANTSGGGISLDGVTGDTEAFTSGGSLNLKNLNGNVKAGTSGGSIYAELTGKIDQDCSLKTSGGSIRVFLPRNSSVDLDAYTSGGHVETDFPITMQGVIKKNSLKGKINDGGPLITLRTSGGSIYIKEL
jgi:hypothetical protein